MRPRLSPPLLAGVLAATLFAAVAGIELGAPGPYYDELHQAPGAFAYVGSQPRMFAHARVGDVPLMSMSYTGAVKSALYGLYMRVTGAGFTLASWRWLGVLLVAGGLCALLALGGKRLGTRGTAVFAALFLSDVTVLLTTRHDWGPTALALAIRLLLCAVWLCAGAGLWQPAAAGFLVGFAVYEKLSSAPLLLLFYGALAVSEWGRGRRAWVAAHLGLGAGLAPLAAAHLLARWQGEGWLLRHRVIGESAVLERGADRLWAHLAGYLRLGMGSDAADWTLGFGAGSSLDWLEKALLTAACGVALAWALRRGGEERGRTAAVAICGFGALAVGLYSLPAETKAHHWILGTPLQYLGIAVVAGGSGRGPRVTALLAVGLVLARAPMWVTTVRSMAGGAHAVERFDPMFEQVGEAVASREDAVFVTATWGLGTQMYAYSQGDDRRVWEPIWVEERIDALATELATGDWKTLYVLDLAEMTPVSAERTEAVHRHVEGWADWREAAPDLPLSPRVRVRRFVRVEAPGAGM